MCVVCRPGSKVSVQTRSGARIVTLAVPSCQPRERSRLNFSPGLFVSPALSRQRGANFSESPVMGVVECWPVCGSQGQTRASRPTKPSIGVSDQFGFPSESGQFWECSALERRQPERKISETTKSWPVSRLLLTSCTGRSLAVLFLWSSATGAASRRNAGAWPCEARGRLSPAPRAAKRDRKRSDGSSPREERSDEVSFEAIGCLPAVRRKFSERPLLFGKHLGLRKTFPLKLPPSAISENRKCNDGSSRARSAATRSLQTATVPHLPFCSTGHHGTRPVCDGLVRFDDFEMQWNGNGACAVAVQRNGEAAN